MSTQASNALDRKNPREQIAVRVNVADLWDATNKRWKSGFWTVTVTGLTWTNTGGSSETLRVCYRAPNDHPDHNVKTEADYVISAGGAGSLSLVHRTSANYGVYIDPSADVEPDGTITLFVVDLTLKSADLTGDTAVQTLTATLTYTVAFTEINAYANLSPNAALSFALGVSEKRQADYGVVTTAPQSWQALAVQLTGLAVTGKPGGSRTPTPAFRFATAPADPARSVALAEHPVSRDGASAPQYPYPLTWVFAYNGTLPDANASRMRLGYTDGVETARYALMNLSVAKKFAGAEEYAVTPALLMQATT